MPGRKVIKVGEHQLLSLSKVGASDLIPQYFCFYFLSQAIEAATTGGEGEVREKGSKRVDMMTRMEERGGNVGYRK